jgi:cell division protein FtsB
MVKIIKTFLFSGIILSNLIVAAESNIILKIGNNTITEDDIKLKKVMINNLFKREYGRQPGVDDKKLLNAIKLKWQKFMLFKAVRRIIMKEIKSKYYDKILTPDTINQYVIKNRKNTKEDINSHTMFLAAADYIKKSKEKDKYEIAYKKYKKLGIGNSYKFFKSAVVNEHYLNFLRMKIKELSANGLSNSQKDMIFRQKLPDYIVNELSAKDKKIKQHLQRTKANNRNYKSSLYMKWFTEQGDQMGVKIFDSRYGSSLKEILNLARLNFTLPSSQTGGNVKKEIKTRNKTTEPAARSIKSTEKNSTKKKNASLKTKQIAEIEKDKKIKIEKSLKIFENFETKPKKTLSEMNSFFNRILRSKYDMRSFYKKYKHIPNYDQLKKVYPNSEEAQLLDAAFKIYIQDSPADALLVLNKMTKGDKDQRYVEMKLRCMPVKGRLPYLDKLIKKYPKDQYYLERKIKMLHMIEGTVIHLSKMLIAVKHNLQQIKDKNSSKYKNLMRNKKKLEAFISRYNTKPYITNEELKEAQKRWLSKSIIDVNKRLHNARGDKNSSSYKDLLRNKKRIETLINKYKIKPYTSEELKALDKK